MDLACAEKYGETNLNKTATSSARPPSPTGMGKELPAPTGQGNGTSAPTAAGNTGAGNGTGAETTTAASSSASSVAALSSGFVDVLQGKSKKGKFSNLVNLGREMWLSGREMWLSWPGDVALSCNPSYLGGKSSGMVCVGITSARQRSDFQVRTIETY
jgi:hypothetical protein